MHYRRKIRRRNKQNTWLLTDDGLCSTKCLFLFNSSKRPPKRQKKQPIQKTHHKFYCDACHLHHTEIHFVTVYSCFYLWSLVFFSWCFVFVVGQMKCKLFMQRMFIYCLELFRFILINQMMKFLFRLRLETVSV